MTAIPEHMWATHGGPGWLPRLASHADELEAGQLWQCCGSSSEVATLRAVALCRPPDSLAGIGDPDSCLMLRPVDLDRMRVEAVSLSAIYSAAGVRVHWLDHSQAPPNLVF